MENNKYIHPILTKVGEICATRTIPKIDMQLILEGMIKNYLFHTSYKFEENELTLELIVPDLEKTMTEQQDTLELFGYYIYNHWDNIITFFKSEYVSEKLQRPSESKNLDERMKKTWGVPVG